MPWLTGTRDYLSGFTLYEADDKLRLLWIIPVLAVATLISLRNGKTLGRIGTLTAVVTWCSIGSVTLKSQSWYGKPGLVMHCTSLLALALFAFSGKQRVATSLDFVAKKLRSRKAAIFSHWGTLTADCHFATKEFYSELESAINAKQWPGVEVLRIDYSEAGLLSHKREYLRVIRQRQLFDICAAVFGKDYFFSVREAEIPAVVTVRAFLTVMFGTLFILSVLIQTFGFIFGSFAMVVLTAFGLWFLFNILKLGLTRLDSMLLQLPSIGPVYEVLFRRDTYFQQDTRIAFLQSVTELVKKHVEEATSEKGLKYLNCFESQPILDGLYRQYRLELEYPAPA
ncbi:MAG TPA: hypothetical protein VN873_03175 [Candidatus Angelobacter sp.]|nr:hypothetical protein [Candidatus Angelobacter sp.]